MKICIVGYSGSGKSTLARKLAEEQNLPLLHLDTVHWLPAWVERERSEELRIVGEFLDAHDSWVIEGEFSGVHYERRLTEADQIYVLTANRFVRLYRVLQRTAKYRGKTRPDLTNGCEEKYNLEFIKWVLWDGCRPARRQRYKDIIEQYPEKTTVISR